MVGTGSRWVETAAGRFEVRDSGAGLPIVFLHGALVAADLWDPLVEELAPRGYRCIAPTLPLGAHREPVRPGTDLTPPGVARLIVDLLGALDVVPATVVSNDTATALVQLVLADHPGAIGRAVLTSGDAFDYFFPPMFRPLQWAGRLPSSLRVIAKGARIGPVRRSPLGFGLLTAKGISDEQIRGWTEPLLRNAGVRRDAAAFLRSVDKRYTLEVVDRLGAVDVPVLLAWSEIDKAFPMAHAHRLAAAIPGARVETVADSACYSSIDNPRRLADLIDRFLRES
jgi:pimeloyl-ACP methyl ester carboxylesterase